MLCMQGNFRFGLSFVFHGKGGGGGTQKSFIYGKALPRGPTFYSFIYQKSQTEKLPLSHTFYWQMKRFDIPSLELSIPLNFHKFIVF